MKKKITISIIAIISAISTVNAQSFKALGKVQKAIISVNTYDKNGDLLKSGTAFYIDKNGDAIADYSLFKGAYKATVIDMAGKQADVDCINGADDTYSVVRFRVNAKNNAFLPIATAKVENGEKVYSVPFSKEKLKTCNVSTIESASPVLEKYNYYTLSSVIDSVNIGCPLFNEKGELIGISQPFSKDKGYALDIKYKDELVIKAITNSASSMALNSIHISKGLPPTMEEALVYAYFKSRSCGNEEYMDIMNRFVAEYPKNSEGYIRRCTPLLDLCRFEEAEADLQKHYALSEDKATANYNIAQAIYNKLTYQPTPEYSKWTFDVALDYINKGVELFSQKNDTLKINESKVLKAQIYLGKKDYNSAIGVYDDLLNTTDNSASIFYAKSLACEYRGDTISEIIALMDSSIAKFPNPLPREAANYILRRGQLYSRAKKPRNAVVDYNQYCYLVNNQVSDIFYYDRSQIEMQAHMYQQAYEDITSAINLKPKDLDYKIEKAGMCLRFNYIDECISLCKEVLNIIPDDTSALRIIGYAQIQSGDKESARKSLQKAIDLGDELAKEIMDKYMK